MRPRTVPSLLRVRSGSPYTRVAVVRLGAAAVVLWGLLAASGLLLVRVFTPSFATREDVQVEGWLSRHRTPTLNGLTHVGTALSDTNTCIAVTAVAFVVLRLWLGRWRESFTLVAAIGGELFVFLLVTATVHRPRPAVPRLDTAPPTSSFPSGHVGAAVALYGCLAVIVLRDLSRRWLAVTLAVVFCAAPPVVGYSRMSRGMHHPTDVAAGMLGGGVWLVWVVTTLMARRDDPAGASRRDAA